MPWFRLLPRSVAQAPLSRVKPFRQERICIHLPVLLDFDSAALQQFLQPPIVEGVEGLGASADVVVANEDLRDGGGVYTFPKRDADLPAPIALLVLGGIEIHRAVLE